MQMKTGVDGGKNEDKRGYWESFSEGMGQMQWRIFLQYKTAVIMLSLLRVICQYLTTRTDFDCFFKMCKMCL